jgi:IclR family KDG regulon transcriptional repressor
MQEIKSLQRAISVLEELHKEKRPLSLSELHRNLGLSKTSLVRILGTLEKAGFVERNEDSLKYSLGLKMLLLGSEVYKGITNNKSIMPILEGIRDDSGETVIVNLLNDDKRVCVECVEAKKSVRIVPYIGQTAYLYSGASGKVILAFFSDEEIEDYLNRVPLKKIGPNTIINKELLWEEIRKIRKDGYAISNGELEKDYLSVSAPLFSSNKTPFGSISIVAVAALTDQSITRFASLVKYGSERLSILMNPFN